MLLIDSISSPAHSSYDPEPKRLTNSHSHLGSLYVQEALRLRDHPHTTSISFMPMCLPAQSG